MANHALDLNPPNADYHLSTHGSDWLWAAFCIFAVSLLTMVVLNFLVSSCVTFSKVAQMLTVILQRPRGTRLFHQIAIVVLATASISYFSMASDLGATPIQVEFRGQGTRQIWVSYLIAHCNVDEILTLPLTVCAVHPVVHHLPVVAP